MQAIVTEIEGVQCVLGEGLHWDSDRGLLWFVDITGCTIHWFDVLTCQLGRRSVGTTVGWVIPIKGKSTVLAGMQNGIVELDPFDAFSDLRFLHTDQRYPPSSKLRLNDAKADRFGRVWCGCVSLTAESQAVASVARIDPRDGCVLWVDDGYQVANGPAISPDSTYMLHSDSARGITYRFDLDQATGCVISKSVWRAFESSDGSPDGMNFDSEGNVWIAFWGGGCIAQFAPDGRKLREISLPASLVTNVCFGGPDLLDMFVTTAANCPPNVDAGAWSDRGGALFHVRDVGVSGVPAYVAAL
jgi:D-xylonolactonase